jgi:hypothetical protein
LLLAVVILTQLPEQASDQSGNLGGARAISRRPSIDAKARLTQSGQASRAFFVWYAAGAALKDYNLGTLGNTIAGAIGGAGGGQILQALIPALAAAASRGNLDVGALIGQLAKHSERGAHDARNPGRPSQ